MIFSAEEFVRLRMSESISDQQRARTEPASIATWAEVIANYPEMKFWVAQNKTVPVEILAGLVKDRDSRVRSMVARKRKLPGDLLTLLASDPDDAVRLAVARNPKAVIAAMAEGDPWVEARRAAAARLA